jgi:kynurenine formamidase
MRVTVFILLIGLLSLSGCAKKESFPSGRWVDLSYDFSSDTVYWPTSDPFNKETVSEGFTEKGYYYSAYKFCAAEHGGTHLDAPLHFAEGRRSVDEIPLAQLIAPAIKIDVAGRASTDRDYRISVQDLTSWESQHGPIPDASILFLHTGFGKHWPDRSKYLGTDKRGPEGVAELHFPGLHPEAADWLVKNRKVSAVGIDTASIDYGQSQDFESHVILMGQNIPAFENVANLDEVPATGAHVIAMPMKIKGGSGAPLRIIALIPDR